MYVLCAIISFYFNSECFCIYCTRLLREQNKLFNLILGRFCEHIFRVLLLANYFHPWFDLNNISSCYYSRRFVHPYTHHLLQCKAKKLDFHRLIRLDTVCMRVFSLSQIIRIGLFVLTLVLRSEWSKWWLENGVHHGNLLTLESLSIFFRLHYNIFSSSSAIETKI